MMRATALLVFLLSACSSTGENAYDTESMSRQASTSTARTIKLDINPPTSLEVSCTEAFGWSCEVEWSDNHGTWDDVLIYRNTVDDPSTSTQIARVWAAMFFYDRSVEEGQQYYYWARFEDRRTGERSTLTGPTAVCVRRGQTCSGTGTNDNEPSTPETETEATSLPFPRDVSEGFRPARRYLLASEELQAPIYQDSKYLYVGIDQGREVLQALARTGTSTSSSSSFVCNSSFGCYNLSTSYERTAEIDERDDWTIRYGEMTDTRTLNSVDQGLPEYFKNTAQLSRLGTPLVMRFETVPTVRFGGTVSSTDIGRLTTVMQIINSSLPDDWKLDLATGIPETKPEDLAGTIYVEFLPQTEYQTAVDSTSLGSATVSYSSLNARVSHAHIQINRTYANNGETEAALVLAHELIHALGIGHAVPGMNSMMTGTPPTSDPNLPLPILYRDDRRALNALYSDLSAGDPVTNLGSWDDTVKHLVANNDQVAFGVAHADGYGEPWAYGNLPETNLARNPDLHGTAEWSGILLGYTSDDEALSGEATLAVQMNDLTGTADFTNLETWADEPMPGEAGQGTDWSVGDLSYDILVTENTFRQIGGDEGRLTGAFFGDSHEAAGGTLYRNDMTGAFGAVRED